MPRRILLLVTDLEIGGTPTVVRELAVRLNDPPWVAVEVACLKGWGPVADPLRDAGIAVTALDVARARSLPYALGRLVGLIRGGSRLAGRGAATAAPGVLSYYARATPRTGGFDTVVSFLLHANAFAAAASPWCAGVRFVQSIQTTQPDPRWHWRLQRLAGLAARHVVVPSESVARVARQWSGIPDERTVVIPNAVDVGEFAGIAAAARPGPPRRPFPIGFLGRLDPVKRIPDLLEAVRCLDGLVELHVFGTGAERRRLEREIDRLGITHRVTLHGAVPRPQDALREVGLIVLPSAAEGFGLVLIEAMAAGVPVVATDVPGIRDVVRPGETGLLVPAGAPAELAAAIRRVVEDDSLRAALVGAGRADVAARFSWEAVLPQYRRLLGLPPPGQS